MRVVKVTPTDDLNVAINSALSAENLGFGWVILRSDRCPLAERQHQTGEEPSEEEAESHCPTHDHLEEYVVMVVDERIPTGMVHILVDGIEMTLATDDVMGHDDVYVPDETDDDEGEPEP